MKSSLIILLSVFMVMSCKQDNKNVDNEVEGIGGMEVPKERVFTTAELAIGRRICSALKHKRLLFESLNDMEQKFRFSGEQTNCQTTTPYNMTEFSVSISNANVSNFEYVATANRYNYFKDVVTDQTGAMDSLCVSLSSSDSVSNQILSGSSYLFVNLLIKEGYDRFEVSKKTKDSKGNYNLASIESVSVITQKTQANEKFFGVEKERVRNTPCPENSKTSSYLKQTWVSATTPF